MTKEKIKEALRCCKNQCCSYCPHWCEKGCQYQTLSNALDLITEQENEIDRLKAEKKQAQVDVLKKLRLRVSDKEALIQSYIADSCLTIEDIYTEIDELIEEVE